MAASSRKIRVPVKLVNGQWELLYGGPVRVADGAFGELHLDRSAFDDKDFLKALTQKRRVEVLPEGIELRVALSIHTPLPGFEHCLISQRDTPYVDFAKVGGTYYFVPVWLASPSEMQRRRGVTSGALTLVLEGMEPRAIESGQVRLPDIPSLGPADSLNHAFTLLSEVFEPWRQAHTGNIYERIFYKETDGLWYPLDALRDKQLAEAEREVISALWKRVTQALGTALS